MKNGLVDLKASLIRSDIWLYFAFSDTKSRYVRSTLGPWWITLGTGLGVIGLALVWSAVMSVSLKDMLPKLAVGLVLWYMIAGIISESSNCFNSQSQIIKNYNLPISIHILRLLSKHLVNFSHNVFIVLLVYLFFGFPSFYNLGWAMVGLFILMVNLWWVSLVLSTIGARYRDLGAAVDAIMPVLFFLTPILYEREDILPSATWFGYNPIALLFSLVKNPLLSQPIIINNYIAMLVMAVVGWFLAIVIFDKFKKNIVFWV
ncbi:ABC transporter permease [Stutzerimonas frequens]|uniref:ABC transporter permease n=1 Tax=Stutzerimonas frequens TaxID=2968969 RepID=UPI003F5394A4